MSSLWQTTKSAATAPAKLKPCLTTNHNRMTSKRADYFTRIFKSQNKQHKAFVSNIAVSEKAQVESYLVAEHIAEKKVTQLVRLK
jgi:hypothetical protein